MAKDSEKYVDQLAAPMKHTRKFLLVRRCVMAACPYHR